MLVVVIVALALALVVERFKRAQEIRRAAERAADMTRAAEQARWEALQARAEAGRTARDRSHDPR
jgi:hypothetical protein